MCEIKAEHGANVILDHIGEKYLAATFNLQAVGGQLSVIGLMGGASILHSRSVADNGVVVAKVTNVVMPLFERGTVATPSTRDRVASFMLLAAEQLVLAIPDRQRAPLTTTGVQLKVGVRSSQSDISDKAAMN